MIKMNIPFYNIEFLRESISSNYPNLKFLLNEQGILFFPATQQHKSVNAPGLNYEDDYKGNAVAGIVSQTRVEIRFHSAFSDNRIRNLWSQVQAAAQKSDINLSAFVVFYQGRQLQ